MSSENYPIDHPNDDAIRALEQTSSLVPLDSSELDHTLETPYLLLAMEGLQKRTELTVATLEKRTEDLSMRLIAQNIDQLQQDIVVKELTLEARFDQLTGLRREHAFDTLALQKLAEYPDDDFILLYADLDKFKTINDTLGHDVGDEAIKVGARIFDASLRNDDIDAHGSRKGGDEFLGLLRVNADVGTYKRRSTKTAEEALDMITTTRSAEYTAEMLEAMPQLGNIKGFGWSIGGVVYNRELSLKENKQLADINMFAIKAAKKAAEEAETEANTELE